MAGLLNAGASQPQGPWTGLPTGQQPWSGGQMWQAAQQAPWRMAPWQTQGMPSGAPVASASPAPVAPAPSAPGIQPDAYTPQGTSAGIQNFQPQQSGGGFYPNLLNQPQQQAPVQQAPVQQSTLQMPQIMDQRTWSSMSTDDNMGYGAYVGDMISGWQKSQARSQQSAPPGYGGY